MRLRCWWKSGHAHAERLREKARKPSRLKDDAEQWLPLGQINQHQQRERKEKAVRRVGGQSSVRSQNGRPVPCE